MNELRKPINYPDQVKNAAFRDGQNTGSLVCCRNPCKAKATCRSCATDLIVRAGKEAAGHVAGVSPDHLLPGRHIVLQREREHRQLVVQAATSNSSSCNSPCIIKQLANTPGGRRQHSPGQTKEVPRERTQGISIRTVVRL